jgi:hypothetical protein
VAGFDVESSGVSRGFIYDDGTFTPLNVPGARLTVLHGIDSRNEVAGYYSDTSGAHGVLYDNGTFTPLNAPGGSDIIAAAINCRGKRAGTYADSSHAFGVCDVTQTGGVDRTMI